MLQFHYYYSTYDPIADLYDDPGYDFAGLLSGADFVPFSDIDVPLASRVPYVNPLTGALLGPGVMGTDTGDLQFGDVQMPVVVGQLFGFRVGSADNLFLPGILTISDITFTPDVVAGFAAVTTPTPEPGTWPLLLVVACVAIVAHVRIRRASGRKTEIA